MSADSPWRALKPGAPYGATHGRRCAGLTLLELPSGTVAVCGLMSCATRLSAEQHAEHYRGWRSNPTMRGDVDRGDISAKAFKELL